MKVAALRIHENDNVAIAIEPIAKGQSIAIDGEEIEARDSIPKGHKIAIRDLAADESVVKYGHVIGHATARVEKGSWVHSHNLRTNLSDIIAYEYKPVSALPAPAPSTAPTFMGYRRSNGRVATRNEIWIINTVGCVNTPAERIARIANERFRRDNFDGVFAFAHPYGCSQSGDDLIHTRKVLAGLMRNPNAGGVLVLGLGCENNQLCDLVGVAGGADPTRLRSFNAQAVKDEIAEGVKGVGELFERLKDDKREERPVSELVVGMKCGGSDGFSGITANPLVGRIADLLTRLGGAVLLTEVPEMFGAEQQLMNRAKTEEVYRRIVWMINSFKEYFVRHNVAVYENPSPGNREGGLTTLEEKSLGAIQKGGSAIVTQVLDYGEPVTERGLVLLKAPGNDAVSSTALIASGATILLFTTGRGTPLGFPVPAIKISSNTALYDTKSNWIDFNAGQLVDGTANMDDLSKRLFDYLVEVASGEIKTKNEIVGSREIAIWKEGVTM
jgi:altronate hydrolase